MASNRMVLTMVHPQLASSRGIPVRWVQTAYTVCIAVVVTLSLTWVGLLVINSLLVLPAAAARNVAKNLRQYHLWSILLALASSIAGLLHKLLCGLLHRRNHFALSGPLLCRDFFAAAQTLMKKPDGFPSGFF